MKYKLGLTLAMASLAGFAFVGPGQAGDEFKNKYDSATQTENCDSGDKIEYFGPEMMWPPNHKMQEVRFTATNSRGTLVSLEVAIDAVDAVGGDGGPKHELDEGYPNGPTAAGSGAVTVPAEIRSERSGRGDGRVYTLTAAAEFDVFPCTMVVEVTVPHDMRSDHWKDQ